MRRGTFLASGAYDGDALFENLELMRTIQAAGGTVLTPLDLYVARRPPSAAHFVSQRVRQAYDDFAMPARIGFFLALAPLALGLLWRRRGALAGSGGARLRRRSPSWVADGPAVPSGFPLSGSLLAPAWVAERSLCAWLALGARLRGGVRYGDGRLLRSATPLRRLRERYSDSGAKGGSADGRPLSARKRIAL